MEYAISFNGKSRKFNVKRENKLRFIVYSHKKAAHCVAFSLLHPVIKKDRQMTVPSSQPCYATYSSYTIYKSFIIIALILSIPLYKKIAH